MESRRKEIIFGILSVILLVMIYHMYPLYNSIKTFVGNTFLVEYWMYYHIYLMVIIILVVIYIDISKKLQSKNAWVMKGACIVILMLYYIRKRFWFLSTNTYYIFTAIFIANFVLEIIQYIREKK